MGLSESSLIYDGVMLSDRCRTLSYIRDGLAGSCWDRKVPVVDCCCQDLVVPVSGLDCGSGVGDGPPGCLSCSPVSDVVTVDGVYPLSSGGDVTVSGLGPLVTSSGTGNCDSVAAGQWANVSGGVTSLVFSQPVSGIRVYFTVVDVTPASPVGLVLSQPADCVVGTDCGGVEFGLGGFTSSGGVVSSHVGSWGFETPVSSLDLDWGLSGTSETVLVRVEVLDCEFPEPEVPVYVSPAADPAPWFDPNLSCSEEFLGFLVNNVSVGKAFESKVKDTLGGGFVQSRNLKARELTVRGWVVSSSECGTQYGVDWLNSVLDPRACGDECGSPDLVLSVCCDKDDPVKGTRLLRRVSLVSSVRDLEPNSEHRCCRTEVEFKLVAEVPYWFQESVELASGVEFSEDVCPNWCCDRCGDDVWSDCLIDIGEQSFVGLSTGGKNCFCEPVFVKSACFETPARDSIYDEFLSWSLFNGGADLVNLVVEWVETPAGVSGSPIDDPAGFACARVGSRATIASLPALYSISLDSSVGDIVVKDGGGNVVTAYGVGGGSRIQLGCEPGWLCVYADSCNDVDGVTLTVCSQAGSL